jgi:hypothetical protein
VSGQAKAPQDTWQAPDDLVAGLFREYGLSLVRLAVLLTGDRATAEDVTGKAANLPSRRFALAALLYR